MKTLAPTPAAAPADDDAAHLTDALERAGDRLAAILPHLPGALAAFGVDVVLVLYDDDERVYLGRRIDVARDARERQLPASILAALDVPAPAGATRILVLGPGEHVAIGVLQRMSPGGSS